jgi:LmbE family N-acetylglucosaminyl deacetylase
MAAPLPPRLDDRGSSTVFAAGRHARRTNAADCSGTFEHPAGVARDLSIGAIGRVMLAAMQRPRTSVVISPHFDDAVLSVGGLISSRVGSLCAVQVITVCGGIPDESVAASDWDASTGFRSAAAAGVARRAEDIAAQESIGAGYTHLDLLDEPYRTESVRDALAVRLPSLLAGADEVFLPAGFGGHGDHVMCRDVALSVIDWSAGAAVRLYADLPYAADWPGWGRPEAASMLDTTGWAEDTRFAADLHRIGQPEVHVVDGEAWDVKLDALLCYRSQISPLTMEHGPYLAHPGPLRHELVWPIERGPHQAAAR